MGAEEAANPAEMTDEVDGVAPESATVVGAKAGRPVSPSQAVGKNDAPVAVVGNCAAAAEPPDAASGPVKQVGALLAVRQELFPRFCCYLHSYIFRHHCQQ